MTARLVQALSSGPHETLSFCFSNIDEATRMEPPGAAASVSVRRQAAAAVYLDSAGALATAVLAGGRQAATRGEAGRSACFHVHALVAGHCRHVS